MLLTDAKALKPLVLAAAALCLLLGAATAARAQSSDPNFPAPVFSEEISGRIAPRDVGDPRRTRHFYTFRGVEGDLVITLESAELTGDVDLFTASTQRPLIKFTLYGGLTAKVTKSVYLRAEQVLVLRVEARAAGEVEGSYRIRFGGAFAPAPAGLAEAPPPPTLSEPETERRPGTRRVTSTGARIEEPRTETAATVEEPTPTPTPDETAARPTGRTRTPTRRGRARTPSRRQPAPTPTPPADTAGTETAGTETPPTTPPTDTPPAETTPAEAKPEAERPATPRPPRGARRRGSRSANRNTTAGERPAAEAAQPSAETAPAEAQPAPESAPPGQRLVIVTKDGTIIVREMSKVRRVTVDSNQLVVILKDGKVIRHQLSNVERMSIEP